MDLRERTAVVTGASQGIGRSVALMLAKEGAALGLLGRDTKRLAEVAHECANPKTKVHVENAEIADQITVNTAIEAVEAALGPIDVLVNCAGVSQPAPLLLEELQPKQWERILDTNLAGTYFACHKVIAGMKARGWGIIINIGSTGAHRSLAGNTAYAASKFAVRALTGGLAEECDGTGVRVALVSPGPVNTPIWDKKTNPPSAAQRAIMLEAEDIAETVSWLISRPTHVRIDEIIIRPVAR